MIFAVMEREKMKLIDLDADKEYLLDGKYKVEPIVRCKDCKHFINHDKRCGYFNHGIKINDYCSYGERKEKD